MAMTTGSADVMAERLMALGRVTEASATLESTLRSAFCSLMGSKYAAIVAGGQGVSWLVEQCVALTKPHLEITAEHKEAILAAMRRCKAANDRRNTLTHGVKSVTWVTDGALLTIRSRRGTNETFTQQCTPAAIAKAAGELLHADLGLFGAMQNAVSRETIVIDAALAWERQARDRAASS